MSPLGALPCCLISILFSAIPAEHTKLALLCGPLPVGHSGTLSTSSSSQPLDICIHGPTCPELDLPAFPQKCACVPGCVCAHGYTSVCLQNMFLNILWSCPLISSSVGFWKHPSEADGCISFALAHIRPLIFLLICILNLIIVF